MIKLPQNLAAINWQFGVAFNSISFDFIIHNEFSTRKGIFFQFYDGRFNEVGMYFGIQTNTHRPKLGFIGNAVIFSRWESGDETNIRVPENGFIENADHENQFIGVRTPTLLKKGKYRIEVKQNDTDDYGEWYNITLKFEEALTIDCGSLRFPKSNKRGFDDGGGTWVELYSTNEINGFINESEIPQFSASVINIIAGKFHKPIKLNINYPYEEIDAFSRITQEGETTTFEINSNIKRSILKF